MDFLSSASLSDLRLVAYVDVAFLSLLTYDTLLNINQEYRHIWKSKWSVIKCLYLWARYSPFIDTVLAVQHRVDWAISPSTCSNIETFDTMFAGFGIGITEVILMVRTYALYGRSKKLLRFFLIMSFSIAGVSIWAGLQYAESLKPEGKSPVPATSSCDLQSSSKIWIVSYASLLVGETVIVLLTLWKGLYAFFLEGSTFRHHSHLVTSFYRDGILFYLVILLVFIVDVVVKSAARPGIQALADTPLRVLHSILACHLVIHVRVVGSEEQENTEKPKSSLVFVNLPPGSERGMSIV